MTRITNVQPLCNVCGKAMPNEDCRACGPVRNAGFNIEDRITAYLNAPPINDARGTLRKHFGDLLPRMKPEEVEAAVLKLRNEFGWGNPLEDSVLGCANAARIILTRYAVQQASEDTHIKTAKQTFDDGVNRAIATLTAAKEAAERERDLANRQYEGLRRIIDGASESMTHDDAVQELKAWRDDATATDRVKRERDAALARVRELCAVVTSQALAINRLNNRLAALEGKKNRT